MHGANNTRMKNSAKQECRSVRIEAA